MNYRYLMESYNFRDPLSIVTLVTEHIPFMDLGNSTYVVRCSLAPGTHEVSRTGLTQPLYVSLSLCTSAVIWEWTGAAKRIVLGWIWECCTLYFQIPQERYA